MFYYAEINSNHEVIATYALATESTNANYVAITEEQYTSGNIVGKFYNKLTGAFEALNYDIGYIGDANMVKEVGSNKLLSTRLDNMQAELNEKANDGDLAEVAKSGDYNDLANKPTIPTVPSALPANGGNADTVDGKHASDFATAAHNHDNDYADKTHTHAQNEVTGLETALDGKASATHNHDTAYAPKTHTHAQSEITGLATALNGKANATHTHDNYATTEDLEELSDTVGGKANASHTHAQGEITGLTSALANKANTSHTHDNYVTTEDFGTLEDTVEEKANATHTHAQGEITGLTSALAGKANTTHTHSDYATKTEVETLSDTVDGKANASHTHTLDGVTDTTSYVRMTPAERTKLQGIATGANATTVDSALSSTSTNPVQNKVINTALAGKAASSHTHDDRYYTETEVNNLLAGKAASSHTHTASDVGAAAATHNHAIADIANLASELGKKASLAATEITTVGTDLNNYTTGGMFSFSVASAPLNMPSNCTNGWLIVLPWSEGSGTIKQIWLRHGTSNSTDHFMYTRMRTNTAGWSNWSTVYTTKNPPTAAEVGAIDKSLQMTSDTGDISVSWSGKDVVAQIKALTSGMYTAYAPIGATNNPNSAESFRFMCHKTGSANYGWVMAYGGQGSVYTGYVDNGSWKGWKCIYDVNPQPLWTGASYMTEVHTITPSKSLSECRNGWLLLWSDYDPGDGANNTDFAASIIPKRAYTGQKWSGGQWYCDVPRYSAGSATDSEGRSIKLLLVHDTKIVGTEHNSAAPRNDIVLRAIYEW